MFPDMSKNDSNTFYQKFRLETAIFCPGNTPDHNPAILNQIRSNFDFDNYYYSTPDEMEAYVDAYFEY